MIILAATPIGNLGDASRRLVEALEAATVIAAEDTRTTQRLLAGLGVANRPRLIALHDHNEKERAGELVALARDQDVLVLSDAGMPTVSDPGYGLVAAAAAAGVTVTRDPRSQRGARRARGLGTAHRPVHVRGLPAAQARGATRSAARASPPSGAPWSSSNRPPGWRHPSPTWPPRSAPSAASAVCRELTKLYEEVVRGTAAELAEWAAAGVRGELVVVVEGAPAAQITFPDAVTQVLELVRSGTRLKDAAGEVSAHTGHSSRELYQAALAVKG